MIDFRPITLGDKETIESYTRGCQLRNCDLSFANIYCWRHLYHTLWAELDGFLLFRFMVDGGDRMGYMQPIGAGLNHDFAPIIPLLLSDAEERGEQLLFMGLDEEGRATLKRCGVATFATHSDPSTEDYIYLRSALETLSGRALQPKRNHINQFAKRYAGYEFRPLGKADFEECLLLDCRWRGQRGDHSCDDFSPERGAMLSAFDHFEELGLRGGALFVEGQMVAFTYGSMICDDTFCVHSEKGLSEYVGCYPTINQLFVSSLPPQFRYVNREEDMGIEGLRRAKRSYHPDHLQPKYRALALTVEERGCRELWCEVFGDEESFVDEFLLFHHSLDHMEILQDERGGVVSMLHLVPFSSEVGRIAYIYGVATHPNHRGCGYASQLIERALSRVEREGYLAAMLIVGEGSLVDYYGRFGFVERQEVSFESHNNFDFGVGEEQPNRTMVRWFGADFDGHLRCYASLSTAGGDCTPASA